MHGRTKCLSVSYSLFSQRLKSPRGRSADAGSLEAPGGKRVGDGKAFRPAVRFLYIEKILNSITPRSQI